MTFMTDGDGGMGGDGAGAPADPMQSPAGGAMPGADNQPPQAPQQ